MRDNPGTPGYLSPEQCLDQDVDQRTDIYSIGVTLYEMPTGVTPLNADSPLALLRQIIHAEAISSDTQSSAPEAIAANAQISAPETMAGEVEVLRDPDTGEVLDESTTEVARLTVDQVKEKLSIVRVTTGRAANVGKGMTIHRL